LRDVLQNDDKGRIFDVARTHPSILELSEERERARRVYAIFGLFDKGLPRDLIQIIIMDFMTTVVFVTQIVLHLTPIIERDSTVKHCSISFLSTHSLHTPYHTGMEAGLILCRVDTL